MELLNPISALRFLTMAVTILMVAALFLMKGSLLGSFLLGVAIGLSIGVQTFVWNNKLRWHGPAGHNDAIPTALSQPER